MNPVQKLQKGLKKKSLSSFFKNFFLKTNEKKGCPSTYVLITCSKPSNEGDMEVEMTYEGNEDLIAYLIENAGQFFHKNEDV